MFANTNVSLRVNCPLFVPFLTQIGICKEMLVKYTSVIFHENTFTISTGVSRWKDTLQLFILKMPQKNISFLFKYICSSQFCYVCCVVHFFRYKLIVAKLITLRYYTEYRMTENCQVTEIYIRGRVFTETHH